VNRSENGSSLAEIVLVSLLFMVPLIWLLGFLADIHRGALASTAAAREAGAEAARASTIRDAESAIDDAVARAFEDHGLDPTSAEVRWGFTHGLARGGAIEIEVGYKVTAVQAPLIGRASGPSIRVTARHVARIDPYRSRDEPSG
jgi:hypothetical protein